MYRKQLLDENKKITMNWTLKKAKPLKDRQLIYFNFPSYWNSNNKISHLFFKMWLLFSCLYPIGGIQSLRTEHLFIYQCLIQHCCNSWTLPKVGLFLMKTHSRLLLKWKNKKTKEYKVICLTKLCQSKPV